jgi:hypothetical protein
MVGGVDYLVGKMPVSGGFQHCCHGLFHEMHCVEIQMPGII